VALGDMPWVRPDTLLQVAASITPDRASVPTYQGTRGHPVGFGVAYGSGLSALQGDQGGRLLLREGRVTWLEVDDPGILRDVDVPHDLLDLSAPAVTGPL
jgi:molybdenum cofactor cytidylyltransferase